MATEGESDTNAYLKNDIAEIYLLLQGKNIDGQDTTFGSIFTTTRYAVILLAAITFDEYEEHTLKIKGTTFCNIYRLEKVAYALRLDYDRKRQAKKIYEDLKRRGNLKMMVTEENKIYVTLTEKGIKECKKKLKDCVI